MEQTTAYNRALDLLRDTEAAYLTTIDPDGWPTTRAMLNLRNISRYPDLHQLFSTHEQELLLFFTTNVSSGKITQIEKNFKASAYFCNPAGWRGLMLGGPISVVHDQDIKRKLWQKEWTMYYPGGFQDPDYSILILKPLVARYYELLDSCSWNLKE